MQMFQSALFNSTASLRHGFFTRVGGVSSGFFASLNFALTKGDLVENVQKNRENAMRQLGSDSTTLSTITQIHGNLVHIISEPTGFLDPFKPSLRGDALVTDKPNIALGIITADCVPILFTDRDKYVIGASHAGWKGALSGIIENTVQAMKSLGANNIIAAIGPCIHQPYYEVGREVYEAFINKNPIYIIHFIPSSQDEHFFFDLPGFVEARLKGVEVEAIDTIKQDTYSNEKHFFSCRRAYHKKEPTFGCQLSVVMKQKA